MRVSILKMMWFRRLLCIASLLSLSIGLGCYLCLSPSILGNPFPSVGVLVAIFWYMLQFTRLKAPMNSVDAMMSAKEPSYVEMVLLNNSMAPYTIDKVTLLNAGIDVRSIPLEKSASFFPVGGGYMRPGETRVFRLEMTKDRRDLMDATKKNLGCRPRIVVVYADGVRDEISLLPSYMFDSKSKKFVRPTEEEFFEHFVFPVADHVIKQNMNGGVPTREDD